MEITRRDFIKLLGGISSTIALNGCTLDDVFEIPEKFINRIKSGPGIEKWKNTICGLCPGGCGIRVRLIDDIPVYVKGNPTYPVNQGGMCPLGLNALHHLYHPDRIKGPIKRIGNPGSNKWEAISWDETLKFIADNLVKLRNEGKSHQVAFLGYEERGLMHQHIKRFLRSYGSPNYFQFSPNQNDTIPYLLVQGNSKVPSYDFLNAKLILSFGYNFLEGGYSPIYYTKLYSHHRETQTIYIQIEPRMSLTGSNANKWIPIRPGTYGALALGIAYVLIREELYNKEFVKKYTFGFDDWTDFNGIKHLGFKNLVLGNYYPERVTEITGIPSSTILEIARDFGNTQPSIAIGGNGAIDNTNGTFSMMAIHSLNALIGNFEKNGGIFSIDDPSFSKLPEIYEDLIAKNGNKQERIDKSQDEKFFLSTFSIESFTNNILSDKPYPLSMLFIYNGNPLFESLNHSEVTKALQKIPLIISFDSIRNETSEYAHLILPDHTFLETWDEVSNVPSVGFTHVGIQQPVIDPLYDTKQVGDVLINLAKRIGGMVAESFPFEKYEDFLKNSLKGIYESGKGAITSEGVKGLWLEYLHQRGWHIGRYNSFEEFWDQLLENGGWWNPIKKEKTLDKFFSTTSGKFEFYSTRLKNQIENLVEKSRGPKFSQNMELILNKLNITARGDSIFLPHHEPVPYNQDLPLHLVTFNVLTNPSGRAAHLPLMQEMFGYMVRQYWDSWIEINTKTASELGISDNSWVWVESSTSSIKVRAKLSPAISPNVVAIPFGLGHTSYGRYARNHGINPYSIMRNTYDCINGRSALEGTKVKISKAV